MSGALWRALSVAPRVEIAVAEYCEKILGLESCCPRYRLFVINRGRRREVLVPFVSSYVFARFDPYDAELWHKVMEISGVSRILLGQVTEKEITMLRYHVGDGSGILSHEVREVLRHVKIGDKILLTDGVFKGFEGEVDDVDDELCVASIKTALFGRQMVINQPLAWCEPDASAAGVSGERRAGSSRSNRRGRRLRSRVREGKPVAEVF